MTAIVRNSGGTLDKFIGDALMAFWNAPLDVTDHAEKAVDAAVSMQKSLERMNEQLETKYGIRLKMGIGIHTGPVYVGNMGSDDMVNYTAIGDNVNLASRLEGLSKTYGQSILVSADTVQACKSGRRFIHLDSIRVKGKHHSVDIYSPVTSEEYETQKEELEMFENGRILYAKGNFSKAADIFEQICEKYPGKALFELYHARVKDMLQTPPGEWDGSWTFVTK
jgi:adenylate cyclase